MARTADLRVAERNQKLLDDFKSNNRQSYKDLSARYGVSESMLYVILRNGGVISSSERKPRMKGADQVAISNLNRMLGSLVDLRIHDKLLDHDQRRPPEVNLSEASVELRMTTAHLRGIIQGTIDPTLSEISKIAAFLGLASPGDLLTKCQTLVTTNYGSPLK